MAGLAPFYLEDPRPGHLEDYAQFVARFPKFTNRSILLSPGLLTIIVKNVKKGGRVYPLAWDLARRWQRYVLKG